VKLFVPQESMHKEFWMYRADTKHSINAFSMVIGRSKS